MFFLKLPVIIINFKTYEKGTGKNALKNALIAEKIALETKASIALAVQAIDLRLIAERISLPVFAQHTDPITFGSNTGKVLPELVKEAGAFGTVVNHAEDHQSNEAVNALLEKTRKLGLKSLVCAESIARAKTLALMKPDFIAIEPPELIGNPDLSVASSKPEIISSAVESIHSIAKIPVIAGAGIKSAEDVRKSIELGAKGVFLASQLLKYKEFDPSLRALIQGLK